MLKFLWKCELSTFLLQGGLKANWKPFNSGPPTRNLFHPTSFFQCSRSSPQFSSFQSEPPVFILWDCTEYTCPWSTWSCLVSRLGLMVTSLGVLPRLAFLTVWGEAYKCMLQVVLGDPKKEMTTCDWLVFPGRGGACSDVCKSHVRRSSQHVPSQIPFLILFPCWHLHWSLPHSRDHGRIHFHE